MSSNLMRSIYEYESTDTKVLSFACDELFLVIKFSKPQDWLYVVNSRGKLGYIPANYCKNDQVSNLISIVLRLLALTCKYLLLITLTISQKDDNELLQLIDSVAQQLDSKHNDSNAITDRQVKHAQM